MVVPIAMFLVGTILMYSAVKDVDPRQVVKNVISGKAPDFQKPAREDDPKRGGGLFDDPNLQGPQGPIPFQPTQPGLNQTDI